MLTGDENIVDVDFTVLWRIKPNGLSANFPVQTSRNPGGHREGGRRKAPCARWDRPLQHPADPDRGADADRNHGAGPDAEGRSTATALASRSPRCRCRRSIRRHR